MKTIRKFNTVSCVGQNKYFAFLYPKFLFLLILILFSNVMMAQVLEEPTGNNEEIPSVNIGEEQTTLFSEDVERCISYYKNDDEIKWKRFDGKIKFKHCPKSSSKTIINGCFLRIYEGENYILLPCQPCYDSALKVVKINKNLLYKYKVSIIK